MPFPESPDKRLVTRQRRCWWCGTFKTRSPLKATGETTLVLLKKSILFYFLFFRFIWFYYQHIPWLELWYFFPPRFIQETDDTLNLSRFSSAKAEDSQPLNKLHWCIRACRNPLLPLTLERHLFFFSSDTQEGTWTGIWRSFFSPQSFSLRPLQPLSPLCPSQPHPAVGAMALALCAILVALPCLSHATAPDCEDLVKPIMPEDPSQVQFLVFFFLHLGAHRASKVKSKTPHQGLWEVGVRPGSRWPPAVPQGAGVHEKLLDWTVPYWWPSGGDAALGRSLLVSEVHGEKLWEKKKGCLWNCFVSHILCPVCPAIGASSGRWTQPFLDSPPHFAVSEPLDGINVNQVQRSRLKMPFIWDFKKTCRTTKDTSCRPAPTACCGQTPFEMGTSLVATRCSSVSSVSLLFLTS